MCNPVGPQLKSSDELLYRHVDPKWLEDGGQPSSQAFRPFRAVDEGCLSVDHSALASLADSFERFTSASPGGFGRDSAGIWGVTIREIDQIGLSAWSDPKPADERGPENPAHAVIEFSGAPLKEWKKLSRKVKVRANQRGRLFPVPAIA